MLLVFTTIAGSMITHPFGTNLFAGCKVGKCTTYEVIPHLLPFWFACLPKLYNVHIVRAAKQYAKA